MNLLVGISFLLGFNYIIFGNLLDYLLFFLKRYINNKILLLFRVIGDYALLITILGLIFLYKSKTVFVLSGVLLIIIKLSKTILQQKVFSIKTSLYYFIVLPALSTVTLFFFGKSILNIYKLLIDSFPNTVAILALIAAFLLIFVILDLLAIKKLTLEKADFKL